MQSLDFIYIYGKETNGYMNQEEWQALLKDTVIHKNVLDNIDDCYVDKKEEDEKAVVVNHLDIQKKILGK